MCWYCRDHVSLYSSRVVRVITDQLIFLLVSLRFVLHLHILSFTLFFVVLFNEYVVCIVCVCSCAQRKHTAIMRIAIIGQSLFAANVYHGLRDDGHEVVAVFTVLDQGNREDALATAAAKDDVKVFKLSRWRVKGKVIPEILEQFKALNVDLNVLPYCTQFIPMEIIEQPSLKSIIYHPSLLPKHRGASSINWTLIQGDEKGGFTVFWANDGLDEGPILLQRECRIEPNDTVETLYTVSKISLYSLCTRHLFY